jgi:hypothetical protein
MYRLGSKPRPVRLTLEPLEPRDLPSFLPPVSYLVGDNAEDVALADVNNDGRLDVVVAVEKANAVAVLLGKGDGTLRPAVLYPSSPLPYGVAVADLNGDGWPDIVTADYSYPVSVLLNNGNGSFGPAKAYGPAAGGYKVAVGDVNGDHNPDVAVADWKDTSLWVFQGNGDGTLRPPKAYAMPDYSYGVRIADLDGDGVGDITVDQYKTLTVVYSAGAVVHYATDGGTGTHAVGDVNRDGRPDVVVGHLDGGSIGVAEMLNRGDGTLLPPRAVNLLGSAVSPVVDDFNRDRKPDVAALRGAIGQVGVALGTGDGRFQPPSAYPAGLNPVAEAAGDLNRDHYPDLVVIGGTPGLGVVRVMLNDGLWTAPVPPPGPACWAEPRAALPADAGGTVHPSLTRSHVRDDSTGPIPGKATTTVAASLPQRVRAERDAPEKFRVLGEALE